MTTRPVDIVNALPDVRFSEDVHYNFVYWEHSPENVPDLLPHLATSPVVYLEYPTSPSYVDRYESRIEKFSLMASVVSGTATPDTSAQYDDLAARTYALNDPQAAVSVAVTDALRNSGKLLLPLDIGVLDDTQLSRFFTMLQNSVPKGLEGNPLSTLQAMRLRDTLAILQLSQTSRHVATTIGPHTASIIYGAEHTTLSVAARQLGARVTRTILPYDGDRNSENPMPILKGQYHRAYRFGLIDSPLDIPETYVDLVLIADPLWRLMRHEPGFANPMYVIRRLQRWQDRDPESFTELKDAVIKAYRLQQSVNSTPAIVRGIVQGMAAKAYTALRSML